LRQLDRSGFADDRDGRAAAAPRFETRSPHVQNAGYAARFESKPAVGMLIVETTHRLVDVDGPSTLVNKRTMSDAMHGTEHLANEGDMSVSSPNRTQTRTTGYHDDHPSRGIDSAVDLSVIVPIYNEQDQLWSMAASLGQTLDRVVGASCWQFVLVDNGSIDNTSKVLDAVVGSWPKSRVLKLDLPNYGTALRVGLQAAEAPFAYIINVDFWDPLFLQWSWANRDQYDLILGSKRADPTLNKLPTYRKFLSAGLNLIFQVFFDFVGRDTHGQKLIRLSAVRDILPHCIMERGQFDTELTMRALRGGLWVAEVPVPIAQARGPRNFMLLKIYRNVVDLWRLRRVMRNVPSLRTRYHRWAREDMEEMHIVSWRKHTE
jgi:glycosyltransferase involved in cell wall biosynthesis